MRDRLALAHAIEDAGIERAKAESVGSVNLPTLIGPVEFNPFGAKWAAARCPHDYQRGKIV